MKSTEVTAEEKKALCQIEVETPQFVREALLDLVCAHGRTKTNPFGETLLDAKYQSESVKDVMNFLEI